MNNSGTTTSSTLSNQPTGDQRVVDAAPTPGPWRVAPSSAYRGSEINIDAGPNGTGGFICVAGHRGDLEAEANAALIAEAGTVFHETGLTPQELRAIAKAYENLAIANGKRAREEHNRAETAEKQRDELLAALTKLFACCEAHSAFTKTTNTITRGRMEAARTAIAKAEGRS